jgi:uncharacterized protein YraI
MHRTHVMIGLASLLGAALAAGPALAVTASSPTGHLNVRSGPGFQYQVVSQIPANTPPRSPDAYRTIPGAPSPFRAG